MVYLTTLEKERPNEKRMIAAESETVFFLLCLICKMVGDHCIVISRSGTR